MDASFSLLFKNQEKGKQLDHAISATDLSFNIMQ